MNWISQISWYHSRHFLDTNPKKNSKTTHAIGDKRHTSYIILAILPVKPAAAVLTESTDTGHCNHHGNAIPSPTNPSRPLANPKPSDPAVRKTKEPRQLKPEAHAKQTVSVIVAADEDTNENNEASCEPVEEVKRTHLVGNLASCSGLPTSPIENSSEAPIENW